MPVEHVVILMLENRSFDEYFGTFPGVNGFYNNPDSVFANAWVPSPGGWTGPNVLPYRLSTFSSQQGYSGGCNHGWTPQRAFYNDGAMNGWSQPLFGSTGPTGNPVVCMGYFAADDIPYHWWLAQNFALCDHYFSSHIGCTDPNRLYLISGKIRNDVMFTNNGNDNWGMPPWYGDSGFGDPPPGVDWLSYADLLSAAGKSWKMYDVSTTIPNPPDQSPPYTGSASPGGFAEMMNPLLYFQSWPQVEGSANYTTQLSDFLNDAGTPGALPMVSWIIPSMQYSEHPVFPPSDGPLLISQVLEALLAGPHWMSTVFIVTYDENDGHFDHVAPPQPDPVTDADEFISGVPIGAGFRVPTFVISPWTVGRGVCHDRYDHTSVIRFLEDVTAVPCPNLTPWRRKTFRSLSTIGFSGALVPANRVPARPAAGEIASNAFKRAQGALTTPICACPTGPVNPNPGWESDLSPADLVPMPQTWPPVRQACDVIMTIPSYSRHQVLEQAEISGTVNTATFPDALKVVVEGFEPIELTTPFALGPQGSVASASPPSPACLTRVPVVVVRDGGGGPVANLAYQCTEIDLDPDSPVNQTPSGVARRFTFTYSLTFENIHAPNGPLSFAGHRNLTVAASFEVDIQVASSAKKLALVHHSELVGKIMGLVYDHFGDFDGFTLENESGESLTFHTRQSHMEELIKRAWAEGLRVTVAPEEQHSDRPRRVVLHPPLHV
jgi:phospholipase C